MRQWSGSPAYVSVGLKRRRSRAAWRHLETSRRLSRWRCFRAHWAYWPCACAGPWQHPSRSGTAEAISANWPMRESTSLLHSPYPPKPSPMTGGSDLRYASNVPTVPGSVPFHVWSHWMADQDTRPVAVLGQNSEFKRFSVTFPCYFSNSPHGRY